MDSYEATKIVLSRIQALDPDNASKIMGYILITIPGEQEMIRLALGPDAHLLSLVNQGRSWLGLQSSTSSAPSTPSSPSPFSPMSNPARPVPFPPSSPRIIIPNSGFPSSPSSPWSGGSPAFSRSPRPAPPSSLSYAAVVNNASTNTASGSSSSSLSLPFYSSGDINDEFGNLQVPDQLSFLDESLDPIMSPSGRSDSFVFPHGNCEDSPHHHQLHRRSCSVNDVFLGGPDDGGGGGGGSNGFGWRPCMYYARGFCKNGSSCKFLHTGFADSSDGSSAIVGSPGKIDGFDELLRMKALQQQRFAAASQLMAPGGHHPFPYNKCLGLMDDNQRSAAAAIIMGEEFHKFARCRPDRNDFAALGLGGNSNSSSRQIYLTFPADSTFKEEDVSNYFSMFGPVQDVRIPYQQKRMFGFVTFVYPETVKLILAKGNPHFVCDSRVLVKPYKEKGKVPEKKQQQQQPQHMERGDFPMSLSPTGFDSRDPYDIPLGARMIYNSQEMLLKRKLEEQAELQQTLELQGRRLMNLQLMDLKNYQNSCQLQPSLPSGLGVQSPTQPKLQVNQNHSMPSDGTNEVVPEDEVKLPKEATETSNSIVANHSGSKEESPKVGVSDMIESLEHILPDNLFASPTKSAADHHTIFNSTSSAEVGESAPVTSTSANSLAMLPASSALGMASIKSCYYQMPRFSEAIEM